MGCQEEQRWPSEIGVGGGQKPVLGRPLGPQIRRTTYSGRVNCFALSPPALQAVGKPYINGAGLRSIPYTWEATSHGCLGDQET